MNSNAPLLYVQNLDARYGPIQALRQVSLHVDSGEIVTLIGANGAGKTTTLKAVTGIQPVAAGEIEFLGRAIKGQGAWDLVKQGLVMVPEGRGTFTRMTIVENLQMGAFVRNDSEIEAGLLAIWRVMQECVDRGCRTGGTLPGGFKVRRRAKALREALTARPEANLRDPLTVMDWVNLYALAVNEQNATGGRVVTAPTNGAAGIIPAVLHYYTRFVWNASDDGVVRFLLTAAAIGILYKENASISGAEVGCQGEVGVACSMAAGALAEVLGGTVQQVENAAEIGMEHNLGLTCDPVGGLVQVPCIERNAMASIKAINAARMALRGDGKHFISLDKVIRTMRETGADMKTKYKETARGGLAVNIIEC